jgi:hypothetical protein
VFLEGEDRLLFFWILEGEDRLSYFMVSMIVMVDSGLREEDVSCLLNQRLMMVENRKDF